MHDRLCGRRGRATGAGDDACTMSQTLRAQGAYLASKACVRRVATLCVHTLPCLHTSPVKGSEVDGIHEIRIRQRPLLRQASIPFMRVLPGGPSASRAAAPCIRLPCGLQLADAVEHLGGFKAGGDFLRQSCPELRHSFAWRRRLAQACFRHGLSPLLLVG